MYKKYPCPYFFNVPMYSPDFSFPPCQMHSNPYPAGFPFYAPDNPGLFIDDDEYDTALELKDYGKAPFVVNIEEAAKQNNTFRTALWTGEHLQVTLMSIGVGEDIGLEIHPNLDQFIRIEEGRGIVKMGDRKDRLDFEAKVYEDYAFIIPAGKWHNLINTGNRPIKLYSIYAPPQHPKGTVHETKAIAEAAEKAEGH